MKTSITVFSLLATITFLIVQSCFQEAYTNISGAPAARAGAPGPDGGFTCNLSGCHNSFPTGQRPGWITSNIPGSGYVPGQTYTITATATSSASCTRFGFEITPQTSTGATAGTAIITNATETKLVLTGNPRWITHTQTGTNALATPGTKTWSFNWTAPVFGTGTVTFYGAFNRTNSSGTVFGDSIFTSQLIVPENTTGILEAHGDSWFNVYPVPAQDNLFIHLNIDNASLPEIQLTDISGKIVRKVSDAGLALTPEHTFNISTAGIDSGIYFVRIIHGSTVLVKKVIVL